MSSSLCLGKDSSGELQSLNINSSGELVVTTGGGGGGTTNVEIADFVKGQNTMSQSFPVVISSDQTPVESKLVAEDYTASLQHVRCDMNGKLIVQVDGVRFNGSQTFTIANTTTGTSSSIAMGSHKYIAFYILYFNIYI